MKTPPEAIRRDDLFLLNFILSSDYDSSPAENLLVGYDKDFNLIVLLEHLDYDRAENEYVSYVLIAKDDAATLARRLSVPMAKLPEFICESMEHYGAGENLPISHVRDCFREIQACLDGEHCRYRLATAH